MKIYGHRRRERPDASAPDGSGRALQAKTGDDLAGLFTDLPGRAPLKRRS